jgi:hypothetical protein
MSYASKFILKVVQCDPGRDFKPFYCIRIARSNSFFSPLDQNLGPSAGTIHKPVGDRKGEKRRSLHTISVSKVFTMKNPLPMKRPKVTWPPIATWTCVIQLGTPTAAENPRKCIQWQQIVVSIPFPISLCLGRLQFPCDGSVLRNQSSCV